MWRYKLRKQKQKLAEEKEKLPPEEIKTETKIKIEPEKTEPPSSNFTKIVEVDEVVQLDLFDNL